MELTEVKNNSRGCKPIFYIEVTAHWRKTYNSQKFEFPVTHKMVYKGPAALKVNPRMKKKILEMTMEKEPSGVIESTFSIISYKIIKHLGYEVDPS